MAFLNLVDVRVAPYDTKPQQQRSLLLYASVVSVSEFLALGMGQRLQ